MLLHNLRVTGLLTAPHIPAVSLSIIGRKLIFGSRVTGLRRSPAIRSSLPLTLEDHAEVMPR